MQQREFHTATLENGLTVIGEVHPAVQSAAIGFFVRTGARDEVPVESGVSHFLEHMMFKGTEKRSSMDITYQLGNIGAQANAYTSEELTVYYGAVLPEHLPTMQELLSDMLRPALTQEEFDTEKKVILEEIALYQDKPHFFLAEQAMQEFFASHTCGNSVLGTTKSVGDLSRTQMLDYFNRRYVPKNIVLVASGKFDWERLLSDAKKYCGSWSGPDAARNYPKFVYEQKKRALHKDDVKQSHLLLLTPGPAASDEERYAMAVLSSIIGDSSGSRIYWELIDTGLVESAGADNDERDGVGCFVVSASMVPENLAIVHEKIEKILATPLEFDEGDLERAKTKIAAKIVLGGELPMGRLMAMGSEWQYLHRITPLKEVAEKIKRITRADIEKALVRFPLKNFSEFTLTSG